MTHPKTITAIETKVITSLEFDSYDDSASTAKLEILAIKYGNATAVCTLQISEATSHSTSDPADYTDPVNDDVEGVLEAVYADGEVSIKLWSHEFDGDIDNCTVLVVEVKGEEA